jgi:hypothetical protein
VIRRHIDRDFEALEAVGKACRESTKPVAIVAIDIVEGE